MPTFPLLTLVLLIIAGGIRVKSCAFPDEGCDKDLCKSLDLSNFNALLDPNLFYANDTGVKASFDDVPASLGFYYNLYNTNYNEGVFDPSKTAVKDGAPSLNYFEVRSTMGKLAKSGTKMAKCCHSCRKTTGCRMWLFNPYVKTKRSDEDLLLKKKFQKTGDCYHLMASDQGRLWTLDKVNALCSSNTASFLDKSVKPLFYSGTCSRDDDETPHFVGAHGTRFEFNGELDKSFCLVTDARIQLNAVLRGYSSEEGETRSWMKELGVVWVDKTGTQHTLKLKARTGRDEERGRQGFLASATLDGSSLEVPKEMDSSIEGAGGFKLTFEGVGKAGPFDVDNYQLFVEGLLDMHMSLRPAHPKLRTPEDAEVHFSLVFDKIATTENVHGVVGQTYRDTYDQEIKAMKFGMLSQIMGAPIRADGVSGKGFLEGDVGDYETSGVEKTDCKFSSFAAV